MTDHARCRSCDALIVWAMFASGRLMPLDAERVKGGRIVLVPSSKSTPRAEMLPPDPDAVRYVSHFASCPNAAEHRKRPA